MLCVPASRRVCHFRLGFTALIGGHFVRAERGLSVVDARPIRPARPASGGGAVAGQPLSPLGPFGGFSFVTGGVGIEVEPGQEAVP